MIIYTKIIGQYKNLHSILAYINVIPDRKMKEKRSDFQNILSTNRAISSQIDIFAKNSILVHVGINLERISIPSPELGKPENM